MGDLVQLTLEEGRRSLFWGKEYYPLGLWATEQQASACQLPANSDSSLINTGVSLSTDITPDPTGAPGPLSIFITRPVSGNFTVSGTSEVAREIVLDSTSNLTSPIRWEPLRSITVPAGPFSFTIAQPTNAAAFYRVRGQ